MGVVVAVGAAASGSGSGTRRPSSTAAEALKVPECILKGLK